jgi:hypothetical protein
MLNAAAAAATTPSGVRSHGVGVESRSLLAASCPELGDVTITTARGVYCGIGGVECTCAAWLGVVTGDPARGVLAPLGSGGGPFPA